MIGLRAAFALLLALNVFTLVGAYQAQAQDSAAEAVVGPVNAVFPLAGDTIRKDFAKPVALDSPWTLKGWVKIDDGSTQPRTVAALVDTAGQALIEIGIANGKVFATAAGNRAESSVRLPSEEWALVSLTSAEGHISLKVEGAPEVRLATALPSAPATLLLAPRKGQASRFSGAVANFTIWQGRESAWSATGWSKPNEDLIIFESGSPGWPLQVKQHAGLTVPQDSTTLPVSRAAQQSPVSKPRTAPTPALSPDTPGRWKIGAWTFSAEPEVTAPATAISRSGFDTEKWLPATVPGTVLTSYVDNGVYPDPAVGLNNLLIPERLNRQDYWYRTEFVLPDAGGRSQMTLNFEGVNYAAEVWVNGERLGTTKGAFIRGRFQVPEKYQPGDRIALAVRVSPPPHPGLPHEESLKAGPGQNGGAMMIDGPTFSASEGWDWIPSVRDRNTGIWQDVVLEATGTVRLGDPHVRTVLPKPDNSVAELTFEIPVVNEGQAAADVEVEARFGELILKQEVRIEAQDTKVVRFSPADFKQLRIKNPALWWPNGYGEPALHKLALSVGVNGNPSDNREIRFGIREVSYELSLVDRAEELQRVSVAPARSSGEQLLAIDHPNIRKVEGGWAVSLATDIDRSPALASAPATTLAPHLLLRVNGVPIAVRGGNWGMDDWLKRVSRERMEPYFKLHREAHVNTIRNWMGQNTERVFYDLADEYGLLVLNDFWLSTQDHNGEPGDTALFLDNAADTVSRYRYHPSIALWIGRNEGVPPPVLNTGLEKLVRELDGTRAYLPNSREVNMAGSGPWNYRQPEAYFTTIGKGFSTEVGTPSFPTLETFKAMMPPEDQWPISDAWAYHDWHQGKAGDVASFMKAMNNRLGPATDLADFERKAQLLNYEAHRAIFEGMNAGLFVRNSGRLLWMTQPAWPSTAWQIYSHDYDTHAAYFGTRKGSEPVHVQLNLPDMELAVVNSLASPLEKARVRVRNYDLSGKLIDERDINIAAAALATTTSEVAVPASLFKAAPVILTKLELFDAQGLLLSENFYWSARDGGAYRAMSKMKAAEISVRASQAISSGENEIEAFVTNNSDFPALMVKLAALDETGARVLPAYWSDNYLFLLPGETRTVTIRSPKSSAAIRSLGVGGWNVQAASTPVTQ